MKKKLSLLMAAFLGVAAFAATVTWKVTNETPVTAGSTLIDDDDVTVKTVYATTLTEEAITINGQDFTHYINVRVEAFPSADNVTGTEKSGSTPLVVTPKKDLNMTLYYLRQPVNDEFNPGDNKDVRFYAQDAPTTAINGSAVNVEKVNLKEDGSINNAYVWQTFSLTANKTYTLAAKGTTIRIYGMTYETAGSGEEQPGVDPTEDHDLLWDYTTKAPASSPDNGLYFASTVNDKEGTNNGLKGIKLNSTGYAYFAKAAVAGKLTLTIGDRKKADAYSVNVYSCTGADGANGAKGALIGEVTASESPGTGSIDIPADVPGIWIERKTTSEGVLCKIAFKEAKARSFVDFEITNEQMKGEFDASTLPAGVTFSGTQRNDNHGYGNVTMSIPVDGTVKFTIGGCQYANKTFDVKDAQGNVLITLNPHTDKCYHQDGSTITYYYTGEPTTLTFEKIQYLPYFKAEAADIAQVTVTYKDQNGKTLGTKTLLAGEALGEVPYTETDLTIPEGQKFRGWIYANKKKVQPTDPVMNDISINASVTDIEQAPAVGSIQTYDLTSPIFYPEDHENFSVEGGTYYNNHGFNFNAGGSFKVNVTGRALIELTLCQYGEGTTIEARDPMGAMISSEVPAKAEKDGTTTTVKYQGADGELEFHFINQTYLHKVTVYNVVDFVEKDEQTGYYTIPSGDAASLVMAINAAASAPGTKIFLPNGTYDLGEAVLTPINGTNISIIGESMENTIIKTAPPIELEGLGSADLFLNNSTGLYLQDLTLQNALDYYAAGSAGRAATLHDKGTKTINKNVRHLSHQDTYYSHKTGGLYYFEGSEMHGTVDYLCGNGKAYFNKMKIVNEKRSSATISANSELYVFNECVIENNADSYNLGRAWSDNPVCIFLNTTLLDNGEKLINTRWNLTGINCDYRIAGEYGTKDAAGNDITPAENTVTFTKQNTTLNTILTAEQAASYTIDKVLGSWAATAQQEAAQTEAPEAVYENGTVTWTPANNGATAYMISLNGHYHGITTGSSYTLSIDPEVHELTIRAANGRGGFGEPKVVKNTATAISNVKSAASLQGQEVYNLNGMRVAMPTKGLYIVNGKKVIGE